MFNRWPKEAQGKELHISYFPFVIQCSYEDSQAGGHASLGDASAREKVNLKNFQDTRVGFGRTDFLWIFKFELPNFFADFVVGFLRFFCETKCPA